MSEPLKLRCTCTMQEMGEEKWVKPFDNYFDPNPNCKKCKGTGFLKCGRIKESIEQASQVWTGICPVCGFINGFHFQFEGEPDANEANKDFLPPCLNDDCHNEFCQYVKE